MCNSNVFILKVNRSPANQSPCNLLYYWCRCCCRCLFETWCAELGFWYMEKVIDEQKRIFHAWMIVIETKKMFCDKKKLKEKREKNWQTVIAFRLNLLVLLGLSLWFHLLVNLIWQWCALQVRAEIPQSIIIKLFSCTHLKRNEYETS